MITLDDILEGGQLIADSSFSDMTAEYTIINGIKTCMGYTSLSHTSLWRHKGGHLVEHMKYHESFDWLMPVLYKISGLGKGYKFGIFPDYNSIAVEKGGRMYKDFSFADSAITNPEFPVEAMFTLVVKFIKWYNLQNKSNDTII